MPASMARAFHFFTAFSIMIFDDDDFMLEPPALPLDDEVRSHGSILLTERAWQDAALECFDRILDGCPWLDYIRLAIVDVIVVAVQYPHVRAAMETWTTEIFVVACILHVSRYRQRVEHLSQLNDIAKGKYTLHPKAIDTYDERVHHCLADLAFQPLVRMSVYTL